MTGLSRSTVLQCVRGLLLHTCIKKIGNWVPIASNCSVKSLCAARYFYQIWSKQTSHKKCIMSGSETFRIASFMYKMYLLWKLWCLNSGFVESIHSKQQNHSLPLPQIPTCLCNLICLWLTELWEIQQVRRPHSQHFSVNLQKSGFGVVIWKRQTVCFPLQSEQTCEFTCCSVKKVTLGKNTVTNGLKRK